MEDGTFKPYQVVRGPGCPRRGDLRTSEASSSSATAGLPCPSSLLPPLLKRAVKLPLKAGGRDPSTSDHL